MPTLSLLDLLVWAQGKKCNIITIVIHVLDQKTVCILVKTGTGKSTDICPFYFQCFKWMFSINKPQYYCSDITQPMPYFCIAFSHFTLIIMGFFNFCKHAGQQKMPPHSNSAKLKMFHQLDFPHRRI